MSNRCGPEGCPTKIASYISNAKMTEHDLIEAYEIMTNRTYHSKWDNSNLESVRGAYDSNIHRNFRTDEEKEILKRDAHSNAWGTASVVSGVSGAIMVYNALNEPETFFDQFINFGYATVAYNASAVFGKISNSIRNMRIEKPSIEGKHMAYWTD